MNITTAQKNAVLKAACELHLAHQLTHANLMWKTGFSRNHVYWIVRRLKKEGLWCFAFNDLRLCRDERTRCIRERILQTIKDQPYLKVGNIRDMYKDEGFPLKEIEDYVYWARRKLRIKPQKDRDFSKLYNDIILLAEQHVEPDGSVNLKRLADAAGVSHTTMLRRVKKIKAQNAWPFKTYNNKMKLAAEKADS